MQIRKFVKKANRIIGILKKTLYSRVLRLCKKLCFADKAASRVHCLNF